MRSRSMLAASPSALPSRPIKMRYLEMATNGRVFMGMRKGPFLIGVFLITFSLLIFQIVQIRILSVIAWYYLAFFAISVAMLGMTVGAIWVYLRSERFQSVPLPRRSTFLINGLSRTSSVPDLKLIPRNAMRFFDCSRIQSTPRSTGIRLLSRIWLSTGKDRLAHIAGFSAFRI